ncbi:MAG: CRISPR-associated protein Cas4 [Candidatus Flexifilum sp.]
MDRPIHDAPTTTLHVTDLKNYAHCPRFPYFERCWQDVRPRTYMMDAGQEAHLEEKARARRRTLWAYGLPEGERLFQVRVYSPTLNLVGIIDELVRTPDGIYFPVDYKLSERITPGFELQIAAYALLIEAQFDTQVERGYVYLIGRRELHPVAIDQERRQAVIEAVTAIRAMAETEQMPPPIRERAKCRACEWRRFCNDVV